jgi:hypothetical protein
VKLVVPTSAAALTPLFVALDTALRPASTCFWKRPLRKGFGVDADEIAMYHEAVKMEEENKCP